MKKTPTVGSLVRQQRVLTILLLTVTVIVIWVGFSIYFSYSKPTTTQTDVQLTTPLNPRIDATLFDTLAARKHWSSDELNSFTPNVQLPQVAGNIVLVANPPPLPTPQASSSGILTPSPTATSGATTP
ncbi:hypothetical protein C5B42_02230 [Candidatus Cerribacteria bacterium 'Amazon FNV 2010 28 9']|uniref:Uncharacterized protein n=1 Tax=Candidatus Cerribacteria bacterium 'Amazon FNV 2010 28 9' TaxID=2081795 RepID=A0A317JQ73_9BACT|nr:MAG: hypothetical protein C5B42_02230 [Candidatus Cerribacteria bacterium 'Amazon FNV 2010 28 9']